MAYLVSSEALEHLQQWPQGARQLFDELMEDAGSGLQRELLQRAVAAAHSPAEVHAFADELRGLSDEAAFSACTLGEVPKGYSVVQLLRAEADPIFAFELNGGRLEPNDAHAQRVQGKEEVSEVSERVDALSAGLSSRRRGKPALFDAQSPGGFGAARARRPMPRVGALGEPRAGKELRFIAALTEATSSLDVDWREIDIDTEGGISIAEALEAAAVALSQGLPVPCLIGPSPRQHRRFVVLLQLSTSGKSRAWQLFDPMSSELVWVNEADLLAKLELPFANTMNRRLTRVVLPQSLKADF
jgi:hypothetical protein